MEMKLEIGQWYSMGGAQSYVVAEHTSSIREDQYYVVQRRMANKNASGYPFEMRSANYTGITSMNPIKMPKMSSLARQQFIAALFYPVYY
jgi:hypothetical protein